MRSGDGSPKAVEKLTCVPRLSQVNRPVHNSVIPKDSGMFDSMREFIGKADYVDFDCSETEVKIKENFRCKEENDIIVFFVCPMPSSKLYASFDASFKHKAPNVKKFSPKGKMLSVVENSAGVEALGRVSMLYDDEGIVYYDNHGKIKCSKRKPSTRQYTSDYLGQFTTEIKLVSAGTADKVVIRCGSHRAFDVDSSETRFAVVTEPEKVDAEREVKLYKRPQQNRRRGFFGVQALDIYSSPVDPFQPADVCFFSLRGHEMLLIADEHNDAIHVVDVQNDKLTFARFLCPGNPYLLQPTALNTDHKGRLWVANRGARMVVFQPLSAVDGDNSLKEESTDAPPEKLSGAEG
ncbi:uncharacterized protein [Littorina saxatilis]|uniref:uncharacterized protein n=1 Tax=Littorina saxatilis TaxID=31220 RepID=UPI0038B61796